MKKIYIISVFILIIIMTGCTSYSDRTTEGNLSYYYSKTLNEAFVGGYLWDGTVNNQSFIIPDTIESYPITSLGGYFGTGLPIPFGIDFPDSYGVYGTTNIEPDENDLYYEHGYELHMLVFYVSLGVNVKEARNVDFFYYVSENEDLSKNLYKVYYYFEVNPSNPYIYAVDGKLYTVDKDELLEGLEYQNS